MQIVTTTSVMTRSGNNNDSGLLLISNNNNGLQKEQISMMASIDITENKALITEQQQQAVEPEPAAVQEEEEVHRMSPPPPSQPQQQQQQQQHQQQEESVAREDGPLFLQMKKTETTQQEQELIMGQHLQSLQQQPLIALSFNGKEQDGNTMHKQPNVDIDMVKNHDDTINRNNNDWYSCWKKNLQERIHDERPKDDVIAKLERVYGQGRLQQQQIIIESSSTTANNNDNILGCNNNYNSNNSNNNSKQFALITGPRGSGKSRLARSVWKRNKKKVAAATGGGGGGGYFVTGKFDSSNQLAPYQAYVTAMTDYANLVWEQGGPMAVQAVGCAIHQALGIEVSVLTSMIPALQRILDHAASNATAASCSIMTNKSLSCNKETEGRPSSSSSTCTSSALKRFVCAFQVLLRVLARLDEPLVLLLDGLQYADQCSLDLLVMIVTDARNSGLLVIGTYDDDDDDRHADNEKTVLSSSSSSSSDSSSYLSAKLLEIADGGNVTMVNISLTNLEKGQVQEVLSDTLDLDAAACDRLATNVHEQTRGNQFYTYVYLCRLVEQGLLVRNETTGSWTWNNDDEDSSCLTMRNSSSSSSCNIQAFLGEQLQKYPTELMDVLKVASCFGSRIQEQLVSFVLGYPVDKQLKKAEAKGIIVYEKECGGYFFVHDIVQDAVDELTPEEDRELFHLEVGRRLWRKLDSQQLDRHIYIVLSQMRLGRRLISREKELVAIATLCLHAGNKAAASSSFRIACVYLTFGIDLLTGVSWRDQYDLLLALHNSAAEMLSYSANFERMDEVIDSVLRHARLYEDRLQVYSTRIWALGVTDRQQECTDLGVEVLKHLGVHFPRRLCLPKAYCEWKHVRKLLRNKSDEQLLRLPPLQDKRIAHILRILQFIQLHVLVARPKFAPFVLLKSIRLTLENGISILAPLAFCSYAALCVTFNRPDDAFRYSELALLMLKRMEVVEYLPRVYVMVYGFINGYKKDLRASLEPLLTAQCVGHQTGDLEYSSVAASMYFINAVESGHSLQVILREALLYRSRMIASGQKTILRITEPHLEFVRRLTGAPGEAFDFDKAIEEATQLGAIKVIMALRLWRMRLAYLFRDYELAADQLAIADQLVTHVTPAHSRIGTELVGGLTRAVLIRQGKNRLKNMRRLKQSLAYFRKWAAIAPDQVSAKYFLLKAELQSVRGNNQKALEYYTNAILMAKGSEIVCDWALASEQAARHFLALGDVRSGVQHMRAACDAYQRWGASAKVAQLKAEIDASLCRNTISEELYTMESLYLQ